MVDLVHGDLGDFPDEGNTSVHQSTDRGEVVHRHKGVHLEVGRAEKSLNHGKTEGLENDTSNLVQNTDENEMNLAEGGDDDTDDNGRDVEELLEVWLGDTEAPARNQNSNRGGGLEHLNESNGQVQVCQVAANQAQTEEETDRNNSSEIYAAGHLDILTTIKEGGKASHALGHDSGEDLMVRGEDDGVA